MFAPLGGEMMRNAMLRARNVVVHDPETDPAKISASRLQLHGWPAAVVQYFESIRSRNSGLEGIPATYATGVGGWALIDRPQFLFNSAAPSSPFDDTNHQRPVGRNKI
jgi:hypothetical protein